LQIVESPTRNSRAFLRLHKNKIRAINTHSQQLPSRMASVTTPDAKFTASTPSYKVSTLI
ncbi:hypothetical protein V6260_18210, partial [Pseudoalteromonas aliena]|uniref:hypothetical protein n=1 Tax=Pseudoalteromonas aliena TaxID=247523 RepID=UPI00311FF97C